VSHHEIFYIMRANLKITKSHLG